MYNKAHRAHAPRKCKECDESRDKTHFTKTQWLKQMRLCIDCQRTKTTTAIPKTEGDLEWKECCVCLDDDIHESNKVYLVCNHWVCKGCTQQLLDGSKAKGEAVACPMCRALTSLCEVGRLIGEHHD